MKSTAIYLGGPVDQFCRGLMQSYDEGKDGRLENRDLTKGLVFYFARYDDKQNVEYLLTHPEKYPFLINSRDEEQHALSYFCTRFPEMQKLLFEHGLIPERERGDDARTLRGSQSVHARPIVKRADFFAKKLVESMEASKEQLKQATASYVKSIELLEPYKIGPVRLKLLNLTDNGKRSVMKEA
uniref:Uncharacterized protein n=1 Tax=Wolbachia endosymbiont of Aleurodicus dispersus TaxID=1288877 RepID=A0A3B0JFM3_9RICK